MPQAAVLDAPPSGSVTSLTRVEYALRHRAGGRAPWPGWSLNWAGGRAPRPGWSLNWAGGRGPWPGWSLNWAGGRGPWPGWSSSVETRLFASSYQVTEPQP